MYPNNLSSIASVSTAKSGLSFSKIIGGASKTLNFINQAIPVYYQTKPIFKNAKTLIKAFNKSKDTTTTTKEIKKEIIKTEPKIKESTKDNDILYTTLTFFQ